jgi:hypothetical protein
VTGRLLRVALAVFVVGLALHNLVMAELWDIGVRGRALDVVAAWKEVLLALALAAAFWQTRRIPQLTVADRLALLYAAIVVVYAVIPQSWLGGAATTKGVLYALRHDLVPVGAYALGRLTALGERDRTRIAWLAVGVGAALSVWGLVDVYLVPLQWWRDSGVPGWFREQLSLDTNGLVLPENWIYNTGDETNPIRRLVSTFLSPLATAYMLVVVLLFVAARERWTRWAVAGSVLCFAGLLWTHTRAATLALAAGLVLLAAAQRRWLPVGLAVVVVVVSVGFFAAYSTIGPSTSYTAAELTYLRGNASAQTGAGGDPFSAGDTSLASHWRNLRQGLHAVVRHPQGYGLGNAGTEARRTGVAPLAGESTYTQLGIEIGVLGLLAFLAWSAALLRELWSRSAWLFAALGAVLLLGLQTDVLGVHWLAYVVFGLCGAAVSSSDEVPVLAMGDR